MITYKHMISKVIILQKRAGGNAQIRFYKTFYGTGSESKSDLVPYHKNVNTLY